MKQQWFVTFGFGQALQNCYAILPNEHTHDEARAIVFAMYDRKWSFMYPLSQLKDDLERHTLREVPFGTPNGDHPVCMGCLKRPAEIEEYAIAAEEDGETPDQYVQKEEGTYNPETMHFLCTPCYAAAGMPASPKGWVCP
jgi:hypothetical protein